MSEVREIIARAKCRERCAFMGEPPCWGVTEEWPNPNCDEPGCHAEADAILAALAENGYAVVEADTITRLTAQRDRLRETLEWIVKAQPAGWKCVNRALSALKEAGE